MKTLLVVDNESVHRQLMAILLGQEFEVLEAEDGMAAIEMARNLQPDLILMDVFMPVMDGLTALERLQEMEETRHIPVVMVSAVGSAEYIQRAYAAGAMDYILKPFSIWELPKRLEKVLRCREK